MKSALKKSDERYLPGFGEMNGKKKLWLLAGFAVLFLTFLFSVTYGDFDISLADALAGRLSAADAYIFYDIRVIRSLTAMAAGAGLGMAGAIMQNMLKNPMASPFTLGISQGAAFGASFVIIFLGAGSSAARGAVNSPWLTVIGAFAGSLAAAGLILLIAFFKSGSPETVILSGIAIGSFFQAMTMLAQYFASELKAAAALFWTFGDVSKGNYQIFGAIAAVFLVSFIYFLGRSWDFNALLWGNDIARTLGVNVKKLELLSIFLVAMLASVITSFLGIIGFIGLIAPHMARVFTGHDNRFLIPMSALAGALVLNCSDLISRAALPPTVIPVGIITSFWGISVFIYLILRREKC